MIKFKEHEGKLFRMLDKPEPLMPDSKMPCLVRLIHDDSRIRIVSNNIIVDEFMESDYHRFEIIGYPVAEGSAEWALYQMMQGNCVRNSRQPDGAFWVLVDGQTTCTELNKMLVYSQEYWVDSRHNEGWQLYEPDQFRDATKMVESCSTCNGTGKVEKPEPQYKVGDWVEWCGCQYMVESAPPKSDYYNIRSPYEELGCSVYTENITRKLKPSEVVIHIGCLSGTVTHAISDDCFLLAKVNDPHHRACCIDMSMLDKETRELVESLLKAQRKEE